MVQSISKESRVGFSVGVLLVAIPMAVTGLFWVFYIRSDVNANTLAIMQNETARTEDMLKSEVKDREQDELISQGRVMIGELRAQTRILQDAVRKLDERSYNNRNTN